MKVRWEDGTRLALEGRAAVETDFELSLLEAGGMIPMLLARHLDGPRAA